MVKLSKFRAWTDSEDIPVPSGLQECSIQNRPRCGNPALSDDLKGDKTPSLAGEGVALAGSSVSRCSGRPLIIAPRGLAKFGDNPDSGAGRNRLREYSLPSCRSQPRQ